MIQKYLNRLNIQMILLVNINIYEDVEKEISKQSNKVIEL